MMAKMHSKRKLTPTNVVKYKYNHMVMSLKIVLCTELQARQLPHSWFPVAKVTNFFAIKSKCAEKIYVDKGSRNVTVNNSGVQRIAI